MGTAAGYKVMTHACALRQACVLVAAMLFGYAASASLPPYAPPCAAMPSTVHQVDQQRAAQACAACATAAWQRRHCPSRCPSRASSLRPWAATATCAGCPDTRTLARVWAPRRAAATWSPCPCCRACMRARPRPAMRGASCRPSVVPALARQISSCGASFASNKGLWLAPLLCQTCSIAWSVHLEVPERHRVRATCCMVLLHAAVPGSCGARSCSACMQEPRLVHSKTPQHTI
jgi:hypothetical protein